LTKKQELIYTKCNNVTQQLSAATVTFANNCTFPHIFNY